MRRERGLTDFFRICGLKEREWNKEDRGRNESWQLEFTFKLVDDVIDDVSTNTSATFLHPILASY